MTRLPAAMLVVATIAFVAAALGIGVRAIYTAPVAVDEVQYLLSAISLAEDGNLDITDEIAEQRWQAFAEVAPAVETSVLPDGSQLSPHDPLLPVLLAGPVWLGGWVGAKVTLALLAGVLAAVTLWLAVRRFGVAPRLATAGVAVAAASTPLAVYGQQIYPELPAAVAVVVAVGALTGRLGTRNLVVLAVALTALPWLSIKYAAIAAVLAALGGWRRWRAGQRRPVVNFAAALAAMGALYLVVHRVVWGGWTSYASGTLFAQTGEFSVIGPDPDFAHRTWRLVGLLLDHDFGLVPWQPGWLLVVPAVAALLAARRQSSAVLVAPLVVGWLVATFVALTMHGYWFPGRQLVIVLPLALLCVLRWLDGSPAWLRWLAGVLGTAGMVNYVVFLVNGYQLQASWVVHFPESTAPFFRLLAPLLANYNLPYYTELDWRITAGVGVVGVLAVLGWLSGPRWQAQQPERDAELAAR